MLIGKTERYVHREVTIPRGTEIKEYYGRKLDHPSFCSEFPSRLKGYLILDDDGDMLYEQRNHFLKTNGKYGLSDSDVPKAINILMQNLSKVNSY